MDKVGIARLQGEMRGLSAVELAKVLAGLMGWNVIAAGGDQLYWVIGRVKDGQPQVIGATPADQVVVISMRKLAGLLKGVAETVSFAEVLAHSGFRPVPGELELQARPRHRNRLTIYEPEKGASE